MVTKVTNPAPDVMMKELAKRAGGKKLVLHLGCGVLKEEKLDKRFRTDEWFEIRCDIDPAAQPLIVADMRKLTMFPDNAVDAIWNSHVIEHLEAHQVIPTLKEWLRVLKVAGQLAITLPDLGAVAAHVAHGRLETALYQSPAGPISALDIIYGYGEDLKRGKTYMAHRTGFTGETLGRKISEAGFTDVSVSAKNLMLWADATKPSPGTIKGISDKVRISYDKDALKPPAEPPLSSQRHPGALWKGQRTDELDVPPQEVQ